jgi:hypothetical protein
MKHYRLPPEQEEKRTILAILARPGCYAFLAKLLNGEDAISSKDVRDFAEENAISLHNFWISIIAPLKEAHIIQSEAGGIAGKGSQYYINPNASAFVQSLLKLLFEESEAQHAAS